jgi:zinc transporter ZupT
MGPAWLQVSAATATAWAGALVAVLVRQAAGRLMRPLVYLALLGFGAAAIFDMLPESKAALSWPTFVLAVGSGYLLFWLIGRYVAPICPACALRMLEGDHHHHHSRGDGLIFLAIVLSVHCFLDGLAVTAASTVESSFGLRVFAAVAVHKLPEGFALTMLLMTGRGVAVAFMSAVGIELVTLLGALASAVWVHPSAFWLSIVLANIGGTFLYLCVSGAHDALTPRRTPTVSARSPV